MRIEKREKKFDKKPRIPILPTVKDSW